VSSTLLCDRRILPMVVSPPFELTQHSLQPAPPEHSSVSVPDFCHSIVFGTVELSDNCASNVEPPKQHQFQPRRSYSAEEYNFIISAWEKGIPVYKISEVLHMPLKTTHNIIWRFKNSGVRVPQKRGGRRKLYNPCKIAQLVSEFISSSLHSNATLKEIQLYIWKHRTNILPKEIHTPPSEKWIDNLLKSTLYFAKPFTLKYASLEPSSRNTPETLEARYDFVEWVQQLSILESQTLVFMDEHGYNMFTVKRRARAPLGEHAVVRCPTVRCQNVTVTLAVSPVFGKISIRIISLPTTKETFNLFLTQLLTDWRNSKTVPETLRQCKPILVLDNLRAHVISAENKKEFQVKFLPKYSPFLNLAEPCNRAHKQEIRKYQREHIEEVLPYVENLHWGDKTYERLEFLRMIGHKCWKKIPDSIIHDCWHHILYSYFPKCLKKDIING